MGGGAGKGLSFGNTWGTGQLPILTVEPKALLQEDWHVGRSLGARAVNYDVKDSKTGKSFRFIEGSTIRNVEVFVGKGTCNKLSKKVAGGLSQQIGGRPKDWKHVKGTGSLDVNGRAVTAEVHWFEASGQPKVKFKVKRWL